MQRDARRFLEWKNRSEAAGPGKFEVRVCQHDARSSSVRQGILCSLSPQIWLQAAGHYLLCCYAVSTSRSVATIAAFQVVAKQNSLKRQRTEEKARLYNKSRKSAVATRVKKVLSHYFEDTLVTLSRAFVAVLCKGNKRRELCCVPHQHIALYACHQAWPAFLIFSLHLTFAACSSSHNVVALGSCWTASMFCAGLQGSR